MTAGKCRLAALNTCHVVRTGCLSSRGCTYCRNVRTCLTRCLTHSDSLKALPSTDRPSTASVGSRCTDLLTGKDCTVKHNFDTDTARSMAMQTTSLTIALNFSSLTPKWFEN